MDEWTEYAVYARELGFTAAAPISAAQCQCSPQLRALCTPDQCTAYGTSWVCPPGCGEFSECAARLAAYTRGLVIQTKYEHVDTGDFPLTKKLALEHNARLMSLRDRIAKRYPNVLPLSTGSCEQCEVCTYPLAPCRKPDRRRSALSAFGIDVAALCAAAGLPYAFQPGTLCYVACVLV